MKISQNWLKTYIHLDAKPEKIANKLTHSGLEVASIHSHELFPDGIVIGRVQSCIPHPNADKLNLTTIDIGDGKKYQIICGAKNIAKGQYVLVATLGTILPLPNGGTLKIAKRKIRGKQSEGMVCSAHELGFAGAEDEIWVLEGNPPVGTDAKKWFNTPKDVIYDIDITPNRNDACSHLGVARELGALFNKNLLDFANHDTMIPENNMGLQVSLKEPSACSRYTTILLDNVQVKPSPVWLQDRLKAIGLQPSNNVVDITNFITHDLGQPIHAFDYDQIHQKKIIVQYLPPNTTFQALDGTERKLTGDEIMICDGAKPLAMGGIIGGKESRITSITKRVLLESAYFNPAVISRAVRQHDIHTDASYRFERGTDPEIPHLALRAATQMLKELTGATIASPPIDLYPNKILPVKIELDLAYLDKVVGIPIPRKSIYQILERLDIAVQSNKKEQLTVIVPSYRRDVTRPIDLVEEILRIYGYNQVPSQAPTPKALPTPPTHDLNQNVKKKLSDFLAARGFYEIRSNPFIPDSYHQWIKEIDTKKNIQLINPLNDSYTTMPQTLLFGGLEAIQHNSNRQLQNLRLFEIGKHYSYDTGHFREEEYLAIWATGYIRPLIWGETQRNFTIKEFQGTITALLSYLGFQDFDLNPYPCSIYSQGLRININNAGFITLGNISDSLLKKFHIDKPVFFATIPIAKLRNDSHKPYKPITKYPSLARDISLAISQETCYKNIVQIITDLKISQIEEITLIDLYQGASLEGKKSYTLRLQLNDANKTLQEKEVSKILERVTNTLVSKIGAVVRE